MKKYVSLLTALLVFAIGAFAQKPDIAPELIPLVEAEREFAKTSATKGTRIAFLDYLADDGIIFQPGPVNGKKSWLARPKSPGLLTWQPIFADISRARDLGYTTGPWEFRAKGPADRPAAYGNYVTVWKKEVDKTWKVALDIGTINPPPNAPPTPQFPTHHLKHKGKSKMEGEAEPYFNSLLDADRDFARASAAQGAVKAYLANVADDVRIFRMNAFPVIGREAARAALSANPGVMTWQLITGEVARSGDLGYTYGTYEVAGGGADGKPGENGNYVRVWKRQDDGSWKIVADILDPLPPPTTRPTNSRQ